MYCGRGRSCLCRTSRSCGWRWMGQVSSVLEALEEVLTTASKPHYSCKRTKSDYCCGSRANHKFGLGVTTWHKMFLYYFV